MGFKLSKDTKVSFRLKPGRDDAIIDWLESLGEHDRSYYVREGLRDYLNGKSPQVASFAKSSAVFGEPTVKKVAEIEEPAGESKVDHLGEDDKLDANFSKWFD